MTDAPWLRAEQTDLAVARILEAAGKAILTAGGVRGVTMADIAAEAGCSRATLYRYFKNRHELHIAFVTRRAREVAREITQRVEHIQEPQSQQARLIREAIRAVRSRPDLAIWFEPDQAGHTVQLSGHPELLEALTQGFAASLPSSSQPEPQAERLVRWMIRIIVSFLSMPGTSEVEENRIIDRFVRPGLVPGDGSKN